MRNNNDAQTIVDYDSDLIGTIKSHLEALQGYDVMALELIQNVPIISNRCISFQSAHCINLHPAVTMEPQLRILLKCAPAGRVEKGLTESEALNMPERFICPFPSPAPNRKWQRTHSAPGRPQAVPISCGG